MPRKTIAARFPEPNFRFQATEKEVMPIWHHLSKAPGHRTDLLPWLYTQHGWNISECLIAAKGDLIALTTGELVPSDFSDGFRDYNPLTCN